ncbi:MAG: adenosylcobinamide-GDP ribazoletransferase, partial [Dehalococcoidia bacterium]|nr:adenosylcobinamide-GDP ribazoletransferase [Dehalococcoidia bacterium]
MAFLTALTFLTAIPVPRWLDKSKTAPLSGGADVFARSVPYFPLVGLILGLILVGLDFLLRLAFPPLVVSALLVVAMLLLTGGLHLEGFIDSCDGLLTAKSPEERLAIMKD